MACLRANHRILNPLSSVCRLSKNKSMRCERADKSIRSAANDCSARSNLPFLLNSSLFSVSYESELTGRNGYRGVRVPRAPTLNCGWSKPKRIRQWTFHSVIVNLPTARLARMARAVPRGSSKVSFTAAIPRGVELSTWNSLSGNS